MPSQDDSCEAWNEAAMGWITAEGRGGSAKHQTEGKGRSVRAAVMVISIAWKCKSWSVLASAEESGGERLTLKKTARKVPASITTFFLDGKSKAEIASSFPATPSSPASVVVSLD